MVHPDEFRETVLESLRPIRGLRCRAMFGGHGLYSGDRFFGILYRGRLFFRTDDTTRPEYEAAGCRPFRPNSRQTLHTYYEVPADALTDTPRLLALARAAVGTRRGD